MSNELTPGLDLANSVKVYLDWNDEARKWECAPVTMDGAPLDTEHPTEGDLDKSVWTEADKAAAARADETRMPTGAELIKLMADQLPGELLDETINAGWRVHRAAEGDSNDEEIAALREYVGLLESILGYDQIEYTK